MEPTVWICILTIVGNILVSIISNNKTQSLFNYKLEELTKKVEAHNNLIARMYNVETRVTVLEKEVEELDE